MDHLEAFLQLYQWHALATESLAGSVFYMKWEQSSQIIILIAGPSKFFPARVL